jgi:DNA primase
VALGGRILPPRPGPGPVPERPEPKYKNSQETAIYSKRRTLYALNWAKQDVIAKGEVVVCEGYTDVIGFFQAGVPRAVATCGTALAEEHFTLLRNFGRRIVLAYDADGAGQSATSRVYEWERRTRSTWWWPTCPAGATRATWPAPIPRPWPGPWPRPALPAVPGRPHSERGDLTTAEGRARAAEAALSAVAEHPDDLVRDQYVMQLSDRCRLDAVRLRERLEHLRAHPPAEPNAETGRGTHDPSNRRPPSGTPVR